MDENVEIVYQQIKKNARRIEVKKIVNYAVLVGAGILAGAATGMIADNLINTSAITADTITNAISNMVTDFTPTTESLTTVAVGAGIGGAAGAFVADDMNSSSDEVKAIESMQCR